MYCWVFFKGQGFTPADTDCSVIAIPSTDTGHPSDTAGLPKALLLDVFLEARASHQQIHVQTALSLPFLQLIQAIRVTQLAFQMRTRGG